ncbi:MAG: 23S rRNA (uracil(1939)-C(5))-methyltransferase RlmD, partial [Cyanobacteria bacterium SZAS LIN-2]|nr:23S rRNA (uracil(1939)-C(5))-methyltransferase RlmD [Cyanobacteria bacterium SZAS LIN-2]
MAKVKLAHDLRRGDVVDVTVESLANGGDGVAKLSGLPVFVDRSAVGDKLKVRLFDVRKDFARGEIESIVEPSSERAQPPCEHFDACGGCQWQHMKYAAQAAHKEGLVRQALKHIGGLGEGEVVIEAIAGATPGGELHYRNKAQFPVQYVDGQFLAGYYGRGSHDLINVRHCSIQPPEMDAILATSRQLLKKYKVHAYDEKTHKGLVRHICLRQSFHSGKILATFVINYAEPKNFSKFKENEDLVVLLDVARDLVDQHSNVEGLVLNFNNERGNRILGDGSLVLIGIEYVEEVLKTKRTDLPQKLQDGLKLRLSSASFFQVNTGQAVTLLEIVADMAREALSQCSAPVIVDAYAGVGTIALWLSTLAHTVVAVEENKDAVNDGQANTKLNDLPNVEFVEGRVEDVLSRLSEDGDLLETLKPDLLVVDPPRKGLSPEVLTAIKERGPQNLIYVSCNPTTLARDLKLLGDKGEKGDQSGYKAK